MSNEPKTITINDVEYVRKDSVSKPAEKLSGMQYVCIRTYSAGVHCGYLKEKNGMEVVLIHARRIWRWVGAATLSELSQCGVDEAESKFPQEVPEITLEAIEIIPCSEEARLSIARVPVWSAR